MLRRVAAFELRCQLANPILWTTAAAVFLAAFLTTGTGFLGEDHNVHTNAPFEILSLYMMFSCLFMFVTTAFVADVVLRDDQTGFGPILRSTPLRKRDYLLGRFAGALAAAALCLALLPPAAWLGTLMPWADPAALGPNRLADHLYGYFLIALPNLLVTAAVFFALATTSRSMMATYLGVLLFLMAYFTLDSVFGRRPELAAIVEMADPFGRIAFKDLTRYWSPAERNAMLPDFAGVLLWNRLLWIGVSLLFLAVACFAYRYADKGLSRRRRRQLAALPSPAAAPPSPSPLPSPRRGAAAGWALLRARAGLEMRLVFGSPAFLLLMVYALCTCYFALITQRDPDGRPSWPVTVSLLPQLAELFTIVPMIVVIIYAGELVWRDRDRKVHELIDAAPYPNWAAVVPKTAAIGLVLLAIFLVSVAAAVSIQLGLGFTRLELGKYVLWYVLPMTFDMLLFAALAVFVQAVSPHKVVGWGVMILYMLAKFSGLAPDRNLLAFGGTPPVPFSDMNGSGAFLEGPWLFRLYWAAFALLLLVAAHLVWPRGTETRLRPRLKLALRRLRGAPGRIALAALLAFAATGAWAWWNTEILNAYRSPASEEAWLAGYENKYLRFERLPQPAIVDLRLDVALYPAERRAVTRGQYRLRNLSGRPIRDVHVRVRDFELGLARAGIAGARTVFDDPDYGYRILRLDAPMHPGEERVLAFETRRHHRGFRNAMPAVGLVGNGSMLHELDLLPAIGMDRHGLLDDAAARRRQGLPELASAGSDDAEWASATADITVSTSADQTPVAPGRKVADRVVGGRRIARFVSDRPINLFFAVQSARYAERHRRHAGIDLAVYYHPGHAWNVDRMLGALAASLDYFQASFGPYQFAQARIVEFPGYRNFAKGSPNTIPFSETLGFRGDYRDPATPDYVTATTAHELAHQYWGHQVTPAAAPGAGLLTETLAQYSAAMVLRRRYGEEALRALLRTQLDLYLANRAAADEEEAPLARVGGQQYVKYQKGLLVMYLLQQRLGEAAVNRALRRLLERFGGPGAPPAHAADLIAALRAETRTPGQRALIADLFERITFYDLSVGTPTATRRPDGRWEVIVPVVARKAYADGLGNERDAILDEPIEIGLFADDPYRSTLDPRSVVRVEQRRIRTGRQLIRFVTDRRPAFAGVDPYNLYIDRNNGNNVAALAD